MSRIYRAVARPGRASWGYPVAEVTGIFYSVLSRCSLPLAPRTAVRRARGSSYFRVLRVRNPSETGVALDYSEIALELDLPSRYVTGVYRRQGRFGLETTAARHFASFFASFSFSAADRIPRYAIGRQQRPSTNRTGSTETIVGFEAMIGSFFSLLTIVSQTNESGGVKDLPLDTERVRRWARLSIAAIWEQASTKPTRNWPLPVSAASNSSVLEIASTYSSSEEISIF